ncbi:MAG TPA: hypothetical protein VF453_21995 [Burkholderiaceae bacterium]
MQGTLIGSPFSTGLSYDAATLDLATGAVAGLPRSDESLSTDGATDQWTANSAAASTSDLVRVDRLGDVDFFDRVTHAHTGGFALSAIAGTYHPGLWSMLKPSPDGRYLLGYWKPDSTAQDATLAVFDRNGNVVQQGSPVDYDVASYLFAFDWMPDGRYVFLAGDNLVVATPGNVNATVTPLALPAGVNTPGSEIAVSPDGTKLALKLGIDMTDQVGNAVGRGVLFISDLAVTNLHQLTTLSARAQASAGAIGHSNPVWSPDGQYVAFTIAYPQAGLGDSPSGCPPTYVLPVSSDTVAIDDISDPDSERFMVVNPATNATVPVHACYENMSWISSS